MERLTEKFKDGRNILRKGITDIFHVGFGRFFDGEAIDKLAEYEDLEERLNAVYGECDGILEIVVEHLERHENVDIPEPAFKAKLLTDGEVDRWEEFKDLEEQKKLLKLPCEIGHRVYMIYQFCGEGAWEIEEHKIRLEDLENIGKTVFLTRQEAENKLAKKEGENEN